LLATLYSLLLMFHAPATTYIYTLSLHDALPIYEHLVFRVAGLQESPSGSDHIGKLPPHASAVVDNQSHSDRNVFVPEQPDGLPEDRKSTRLNSSHEWISYAVFCLKKKTNILNVK